jgi:hypothetical protein
VSTIMQRYTVRKSDHGYGVWDSATNGWRSLAELEMRDAEALAEQMNFDEWTAQHIVAKYPQNPAKPCSVFLDGRWWAGHLWEWGRSTDGRWWGRGKCEWKEWRGWMPSDRIRPRQP